MKIQCDCGEIIPDKRIVKLYDGDFAYDCPNCGNQRLYG